jgi:hypothetical protein
MEDDPELENLLKKHENGMYNINSKAALVVVEDGKDIAYVSAYCRTKYKQDFKYQNFKKAIESAKVGDELQLSGRHPILNKKEQLLYDKTIDKLLESGIPFQVQNGNSIVSFFLLFFSFLSFFFFFPQITEVRNRRPEQAGKPITVSSTSALRYARKSNRDVYHPKTLEITRYQHRTWLNQAPYFSVWIDMRLLRKYPYFLIANSDEVSLSDIKTLTPLFFDIDGLRKVIQEAPSLASSTVLITTLASGDHMPHVLILNTMNVPPSLWQFCDIDLWIICAPPTSFMTVYVFEWVARHIYIPWFNTKRMLTGALNAPAALLVDAHPSRYSDQFMHDCQANNVDVLIEPAGASDNMQGNDRAVNGAFKGRMAKRRITQAQPGVEARVQFVRYMKDSLQFAVLGPTVRKGFEKAGTYPTHPWGPLGRCGTIFSPRDGLPPSQLRPPQPSPYADAHPELRDVMSEQYVLYIFLFYYYYYYYYYYFLYFIAFVLIFSVLHSIFIFIYLFIY